MGKTTPTKRILFAVICLFTVLISVGCSEPDSSDEFSFNGKKYTLTISDDFDSFDTTIWAKCPQIERQDAGGYWANKCSSVEDGNLVITCTTTSTGTPISGGVKTRRSHDQTFGLYNIRFKMEKADGLWYAFWLLSDAMENDTTGGNGAVDGAELDILEVVPHSGDFEMSVHWDGYFEHLKSYSEGIHVTDDFYDTYHEIWYLWDKDGYKLYLDGTDEKSLVFSFSGKEHGDGACGVPSYLIISAEYGTWGGEIDEEQLPAHLYVDYVRVYSEK